MPKSKVTLTCEVCQSINYKTNQSASNDKRIEIKKYCPKCKMHTLHKQEK